ncbi:hypothetical protein PAMP_016036 [Pampus punctatissimus]
MMIMLLKLAGLLNRVQQLQSEKHTMENDLQNIKLELAAKDKEMINKSERNTSYTFEELQETQIKLEEKTAKIRKQQKEFDDRVSRILQQFHDEKQRRKETETELQILKKSLENKDKELEKTLQRREDVEKEVETLKKELEKKNKEGSSFHLNLCFLPSFHASSCFLSF